MSFEEYCEILLKPSTELISDEYAHDNGTACVHIFIFKENYEAFFVDCMKLLGYSIPDTNIHQLSTRTEVLSSLQKICDETKDKCSLIILFWGPFKSDRKFVLNDGSCIKMIEIWSKFISSNCLTLKEKPKIFIFNGFHEKHSHGSVARHMENTEEDSMRVIKGSVDNFSYNIPAEGDILIVFKQNNDLRSSVEYMDSLCSNLQNFSEREDIFSLLTITDFLSHPILISTMTRKFYLKFNPNRGLQLSIREKYNKIEEAIQKMRENIIYLTKDNKKVRDVSETLTEVPDSTNDLKKASSTEENLHRRIFRSEGGLKFRPRSNTASKLIDIEKLNKTRADNRPPWKF
ncbi:hypothetical protein WA026_020074 [Henosepilachna vigintioctopunctata]|uniref:Peptidase C14A caspase catalytic domain-containing protein n=1 Tax=Henosepilachna vigintioctopunctata TaxID=420089 RepID=A0AAW1U279_9CUCU